MGYTCYNKFDMLIQTKKQRKNALTVVAVFSRIVIIITNAKPLLGGMFGASIIYLCTSA